MKPPLERRVLPTSAKVIKYIRGKALPAKGGQAFTSLICRALVWNVNVKRNITGRGETEKERLFVLSFKFCFMVSLQPLLFKSLQSAFWFRIPTVFNRRIPEGRWRRSGSTEPSSAKLLSEL